MQVFGSLVFLAANHGAAGLDGARGVAVVGVFNAVSMLLIYPSLGVVQAMQPLLAYNRGAGHHHRVLQLLERALATTLVMGGVAALVLLLFPNAIAHLFTRSDIALVDLVRAGLPWMAISVALFAVQGTASHYFLAVQEPRRAGALLLGRQLLAIPLFLLVPKFFGFRGLYLVMGIADLPMALVATYMLRREWLRLRATTPQCG